MIENLAHKYGKPYPWDVRMKILGTTERRTCEIAIKELSLPCTVDEFHQQYKDSLHMLKNANLLNGAERLIRHLHNNNVPFCLATSSSQESVDIKLSNFNELFSIFSHKVCGSSDNEGNLK